MEKCKVRSQNKVRALFAKNNVRFARAEQNALKSQRNNNSAALSPIIIVVITNHALSNSGSLILRQLSKQVSTIIHNRTLKTELGWLKSAALTNTNTASDCQTPNRMVKIPGDHC